MKYLIPVLFLFCFSAQAQTVTNSGAGGGNVTQICQPKVEVVRSCGNNCCPKQKTVTVEKVVEKIVEVPTTVERVVVEEVERSNKNHISLLAGYGARGNLIETQENGKTETRTENGMVFGVQYLRQLGDGGLRPHALIQAQTNRTLSVGLGLSF